MCLQQDAGCSKLFSILDPEQYLMSGVSKSGIPDTNVVHQVVFGRACRTHLTNVPLPHLSSYCLLSLGVFDYLGTCMALEESSVIVTRHILIW